MVAVMFTWSVIIVNSNWQITWHVGNWQPSFHREVYTSRFIVQLKKINEIVKRDNDLISCETYKVEVEQNFLFGELCSLQVSNAFTQNVWIQFLLLNDVTSWNCNVQNSHTRSNRFVQVIPAEKCKIIVSFCKQIQIWDKSYQSVKAWCKT